MELPDQPEPGALVEVIQATFKRLGDRLVAAPASVTRTDEDGDEPTVTVTFDVVGGRLECRAVVVTATGRQIRRADLRGIDLEAARGLVAERWTFDPHHETGEWTLDIPPTASSSAENRRNLHRSRTRPHPATLAEVARVWRENQREAPTRAVAEALGIAHRTASKYIRMTKDAGLLDVETTP